MEKTTPKEKNPMAKQHKEDTIDQEAILRKTVEWYADPDNWDTQTEMPRKAYDDNGRKARLALQGKPWWK